MAKSYTWDEFGLTDRMVDWFSDRMIRCNDSWYIWDKIVWKRVENDAVMLQVWEALIKRMVENEALTYSKELEDGQKRSWRDKFLAFVAEAKAYRIGKTIIHAASGRDEVQRQVDEFNPHKHLLNCLNGVVDLRTGTLQEHDPKLLMTMCTRANYNPTARAPRFMKFLSTVQANPEMRDYLQRVFGYGLTGETREQKFHVHKGTGGNGKGVMTTCITRVMGSYAQTLAKSVILDSRNKNAGGPSAELARIAGARLVTFSELNVGEKFDEAKVKELSGQDRQEASYKFKNPFEFDPQAKLHGFTNNMPRFSGGGNSLDRRLRVVDWGYEVSDAERQDDLGDRLVRSEAEGILAWAVKGAVIWYRDGLACPEVVMVESKKVLQGGDPFRSWADERCRPSKLSVDIKELYDNYKEWCEENSIQPVAMHRSFPNALEERGMLDETGKKDSKTRRKLYRGLKLRDIASGASGPAQLRRIK